MADCESPLFCLGEDEVKAIIMSFLKARGDKGAYESEIEKALLYFDLIRFENELLQGVINGDIGTTIANRNVVYVSKDYKWKPRDKYEGYEINQKSKGLCIKCRRPATSKTLCDYHRQKKHESNFQQKELQ